jgi:SAM-dependent methyltransferase
MVTPWEHLGRTDPLWAICSDADKIGNRWDRDEFFRTGVEVVAHVMATLEGLGLPAGRGRCLDFGCGVGRLSQAFAGYFERCDGVDVAPSMIGLARQWNRHEGRCQYHLNQRDDLALFSDDSFDLVFSYLVLQHIPSELSATYIREFIRVLRPGGVAVFQVPCAYAPPPPLEAGDHQAGIVLGPMQKDRVRAGQRVSVDVEVHNRGRAVWHNWATSPQPVLVGNHWSRLPGQRLVMRDDGRANLPADVPPGGRANVSLEVTAPPVPGRYLLEVDLVEEGVTWFAEHSPSATGLVVEVGGWRAWTSLRRALGRARWRLSQRRRHRHEVDGGTTSSGPQMEMHFLPRARVEECIAAEGGVLLAADEDGSAGYWPGYRYTVTKPKRGLGPEAPRTSP